MALDFQQVREQIMHFGDDAHQDEARLTELYEVANHLIEIYANDLAAIRQKVFRLVHNNDPFLRCAMPVHEPLSAHFAAPSIPKELTVIAADGSQILPDRHAQVEYCLINVGAV